MAKWPYGTKTWRIVRQIALQRDKWECKISAPGCLGRADSVDHIVPLADGGAPYDLGNLRAACVRCNSGRVTKSRDAKTTLPPSRSW